MRILLPLLTLLCYWAFLPTLQAQPEKNKKAKKATLAYFQQGYTYYEEGKVTAALTVWKDIVAQEMGRDSDIYGCAFYNIPTVYFYQKNYQEAEEWFKKVIDSDLNDQAETGNLMEPHANYKHKSALSLVSIYSIKEDWAQAIAWLEKADKTYQYWGFEGSKSNIIKKQTYLMQKKVELLQQVDLALLTKIALTDLIIADGRVAFYEEIQTLFLEKINQETFKTALDEALEQATLISINEHHWELQFELNQQLYKLPISDQALPKERPQYRQYILLEEGTTPTKALLLSTLKSLSFYTMMGS